MQIANLTSTHPPITERIKILRSLGGGVDYKSYQSAFTNVHGRSGQIIPASAIEGDNQVIKIREQSLAGETFDYKTNKRTIGDIVMQMNGYSILNCTCGMKIKLPPGFGNNKPEVTCPRCKTIHNVSTSFQK
jgi:heat shock protein HtpX